MSTFPPIYGPGMFTAPSPLVLRGECNMCGLCCVEERDGELYRCMDLVQAGRIGQPYATACTAYEQRYDRMPIVLRAESGKRIHGWCGKNSIEETRAIVQRGIGKGCSYEVLS